MRLIAVAIGTIWVSLVVTPMAPAYAQTAQKQTKGGEAPKLAVDLHETIVWLPVTVKLVSGKSHAGQMIVTHYRPDGDGPFPAIIMNHGRAPAKEKRAEPPRFRHTGIVQYWIRRGFAVLVPTRLGYGETGLDPDPEYAGTCNNRDYRTVLTAMIAQIRVALEFAATLPWVDTKRVILMGQSQGGFASIGASGHDLSGVIGAINFAGGAGGDPDNRPGQPCSPAQISAVLSLAGKRAKSPMLWLYSENDKHWGAEWPRKWHAAYTKGGARAELKMFPPVSDNGHALMDKGFRLWRPVVDQFMGTLGFAAPKSKDAPAPTGFASIEEADKLPHVGDDVKSDAYQKFLDADVPRAFAISSDGVWVWRTGENAPQQALEGCQQGSKRICKLYAVDDAVVWKP